MKKTVAILGEDLRKKLEIAIELANDSYPVVLQVEIGCHHKVRRRISKRGPGSAMIIEEYSFACAWEADIVVIVDNTDKMTLLAREIENYITGKIIVILNENALSAEVKLAFSYAKKVFIYNTDHIIEANETLDFFDLVLSAETISGSELTRSILRGGGDAGRVVKEIERLLEVFY